MSEFPSTQLVTALLVSCDPETRQTVLQLTHMGGCLTAYLLPYEAIHDLFESIAARIVEMEGGPDDGTDSPAPGSEARD